MPASDPREGLDGCLPGHVPVYVPHGRPDENGLGIVEMSGPDVAEVLSRAVSAAEVFPPGEVARMDQYLASAHENLAPGVQVLALAGPPIVLLGIARAITSATIASTIAGYREGRIPRGMVPPEILESLDYEDWRTQRDEG